MEPVIQAESNITEKVSKEEELKKRLEEVFKLLGPEERKKAEEGLITHLEKEGNVKESVTYLVSLIPSGKELGEKVATLHNITEKLVKGSATKTRSFFTDIITGYKQGRK